ncbi:plakophilin-3-like isoform X1 [Corythoichthys intestinalis]|uniref:plakophilin-3-like isoform X1 n=1 Tax=Corythoichthys intestinalis TaxID=161448 RepID=UPI0025A67DA4|nr:plakophilin-3-like isoform X1 [Corythoichthys intestinalis]XP_061813206.1 plakophilin-3-like [Nerophis lumbriciformis]
MSTVASENVFLSALQPNNAVTTYGLPSEIHLGSGASGTDDMSRARRVQQQVQMRLAEKSTLPRHNGSISTSAMSDYGGSSTMKYQTYNPGYSSKSSYAFSSSRTMAPQMAQRSGFSSLSTGPDMSQFHRISVGGGGGYYRDDGQMGTYQMNRQQTRMEPEIVSLHGMRQQTMAAPAWMVDGSDGASMASDRDAVFNRQYVQSNGYSTQMRQSAGSMTFPASMRRSHSGTIPRMTEMDLGTVQQSSYKGPAYRTISRINNRNNRMSMGSMSGTLQRQMSGASSMFGGGVDRVDSGFIGPGMSSASQGNLAMQRRQSTISRAMSIKSMQSVGRGADIFNEQMGVGSMGNLAGIETLDMSRAVQYLREPDSALQVLGAAYIQHECYNDSDAKNEVRLSKGISELVKLFNSDSQEVQRYATGATRNLIYENMENKVALIEEGGIPQLVEALKEPDDELQKNITGILWNLSSKDTLKEKLAREALPDLTDKILIPLSGSEGSEGVKQSASEAEIFFNTTGCLRNLSSVNEKTRQNMRQTHGLVDSLVTYIKSSLEENKAEDKGVENAVCVLRNLSYQLYSEMPPSALLRLEGPSRAEDSGKGESIGCFTPQSKKANSRNQDLSTFTEVARVPKGMEWLWHPQIVGLYNRVLQQCEINSTTREAAAGALQNITAGDRRWAGVLSRVAMDQERMVPVLLDLLRTNNDSELRSITGFLRNLSRHAKDKNHMATKVVNNLVTKLPTDGYQKEPSSDVVVNICGILNNLVTCSSVAARDICFFDGLPKLVAIKNTNDSSSGKMKAAKAAATVLSNMFQYRKLHKDYKNKGFTRPDFADMSI